MLARTFPRPTIGHADLPCGKDFAGGQDKTGGDH
jgi:hypothetical protein